MRAMGIGGGSVGAGGATEVAPVHVLCRSGLLRCALPVSEVVETLRPLPLRPVAGAPPAVLGVAIVRGEPTPVVDLAAAIGAPAGVAPGRFVVVRAGERRVALAVGEVLGVRALDAARLRELPPLLRDARDGAVESIATLDGELVAVIAGARVLPADDLAALLGAGR